MIKTRGRGANKQVIVSWRGYPSKFDTWIPASSLISLREEQFLLVLPSNSSMRHSPNNTTSSFITELFHSIVLHGEWEVAINEI